MFMEGNIAVAVNSTTVSSPTLKDSADQDVSVSLATIIILSLINSASSVIGTLGNLLVIAALVNDRRLRSSTDYFIASLSVADLLVTSLYQPLSVFRLYFFRTLQEHGIFRGIMGFVGFLSALASVTSMFVITIDRLVSIVKPLRYETLVTKRVTYAAICVTWSFSFGVSIIQTTLKPEGHYIGIYCSTLLVVTILVYAFILKTARAQEKKVAVTQPRGEGTMSEEKHRQGKKLRRHQKHERKAARTVAIVIGVFFVCWIPFLAYVLSVSQSKPWFLEGFLWAQTASLCNSFINPYIYCIRSQRYRSAMKKFLGLGWQFRSRNRVKPRSNTVSTSVGESDRVTQEQQTSDKDGS